jgi:hypothetical protein
VSATRLSLSLISVGMPMSMPVSKPVSPRGVGRSRGAREPAHRFDRLSCKPCTRHLDPASIWSFPPLPWSCCSPE